MRRRRVLFTSHTSNFQKFNHSLMRLFMEKGWEVHYASMGEEEITGCDKSFIVSFSRNPLSTRNLKAYSQMKQIIADGDYDIIHTHTPVGSVITRLASRKARKRGTKIIYTAHGFHFFDGAPLLNWALWYPIEKYMSRHTDTLITINKEDYDRAKRKFSTEVHYIPGAGIDPNKFDFKMSRREKLALRYSLGIKPDDFVIIYIAELNKRKNQEFLLRSLHKFIAENEDVHVLLPGMDSMKGYHENLAKQLGISDRVHFMGYRHDIPKIIKISDLSLSTSRHEGLAVNVMETLYSGIPTIVSDVRGNRDFSHVSLLSIYHDADDLVEKVSGMYRSRGRRSGTGTVDMKRYLLENVTRKMSKIYKLDTYGSSKKTNVLIVIGGLDRGGSDMFVVNTTKNLDTSKYNIKILCFSDYSVLPDRYVHQAELESMGIDVIKIENDRFIHPIRFMRHVGDIIKKNKIDIVHSHVDFMSSQILVAAYVQGVKRRIAHSHNTSNPKTSTLLGSATGFVLKKVVGMLSTDRLACGLGAGKWLYGKRSFTVINNGIDLSRFAYNEKYKKSIRKEYGIASSSLVVLTVGRLAEVKNHKFLINVFAQLHKDSPNSVLIIVGQGELYDDLMHKAKSLGISNSIIILSTDEVYKYYSAADVFVMPSLFEGFPFVAVEAQANALPCVFSDKVSREVKLSDNVEFIGLDAGYDTWSERISSYGQRKITNHALSHKLSEYDVRKSAQKLEEIYGE